MSRWKHLRDEARACTAAPRRARELYTAAISEAREPDQPELLAERADVSDRLGLLDEARADRERAVTLLEPEISKGAQAPKVPGGLFDDVAFDRQRQRWIEQSELHRALGLEAEARADLDHALAHVDHQIQHCERARRTSELLEQRGALLDLMGSPIDADRHCLLAADVLAASAGENPAGPAMATAPFYVARFGAAGLEFADAFRAGWNSNLMAQVEAKREALLRSGRAVGLGSCKKCGDIVPVSAGHRCAHGHKVDRARYVVPDDADVARAQLAAAMPSPRR